jgi:TRAP-type mannitol/chloroaromatic compound transport system permease large subunit
MLLIALVLGSIYAGIATANRGRPPGSIGALLISAVEGSPPARRSRQRWERRACTA